MAFPVKLSLVFTQHSTGLLPAGELHSNLPLSALACFVNSIQHMIIEFIPLKVTVLGLKMSEIHRSFQLDTEC